MLRLTHRAVPATSAARSASDYPDVAVDDFHIDAMTVHLLRRASAFDVARRREHVRRHPVRPGRRAGRVAGHRAVDQRLGRPVHGAGRARLRAGHRRAAAGQPDRDDPVRRRCCSTGSAPGTTTRAADAAVRSRAARPAVAGTGVSTGDLGGTAGTAEFTAAVRPTTITRLAIAEILPARAGEAVAAQGRIHRCDLRARRLPYTADPAGERTAARDARSDVHCATGQPGATGELEVYPLRGCSCTTPTAYPRSSTWPRCATPWPRSAATRDRSTRSSRPSW